MEPGLRPGSTFGVWSAPNPCDPLAAAHGDAEGPILGGSANHFSTIVGPFSKFLGAVELPGEQFY